MVFRSVQLFLDLSICVGNPVWTQRRIVFHWYSPQLDACVVLPNEVLSSLSISELYHQLQDVIGASVGCLEPISKARILIFWLHVLQSFVWISIVAGASEISIDSIAPKPLLKSQGAHHIIVRHGVIGVKGVFDWFFCS